MLKREYLKIILVSIGIATHCVQSKETTIYVTEERVIKNEPGTLIPQYTIDKTNAVKLPHALAKWHLLIAQYRQDNMHDILQFVLWLIMTGGCGKIGGKLVGSSIVGLPKILQCIPWALGIYVGNRMFRNSNAINTFFNRNLYSSVCQKLTKEELTEILDYLNHLPIKKDNKQDHNISYQMSYGLQHDLYGISDNKGTIRAHLYVPVPWYYKNDNSEYSQKLQATNYIKQAMSKK